MKTTTSLMRFAGAASLAFALAVSTPAQAPQAPGQEKSMPFSKIERKNKAPVSQEILQVKLPKPFETVLQNGLTVLILEDHRFPVVNVSLNISGAGGLYDPSDAPGLASTAAQMLREGTKTRTSKQIAEEVDRLGATLFASSVSYSSATVLTASGLSDNLDDWLALLADVLLNPTFPETELNVQKQRAKASLAQSRTQPSVLANERFSRAVFGTHPAAVTVMTPASIDAMTPEKLAAWHKERYAPQNSILGIAGDVRPAEIMPKLEKWLGSWAKTGLSEVLPPNPVPATARKIYLVDRPKSVQTTIRLGNIAIDRRDPDYPAMVVMDRIIGGGPAARLFINLREEKGYTYGVYSNFVALKYPGAWSASGDYRSEVTEGVMTELMKEINRICNEKVPAPEMDEVKRSLVANFALSLESAPQLLNYAIQRKIYGFPADYWDTYPARLSAVSADDVQRMARKYLDPNAIQIVAVGEAAKIKATLEKFGPVEVYDTEGKPAAKSGGGGGR